MADGLLYWGDEIYAGKKGGYCRSAAESGEVVFMS
jgi:hypothetical protein